MKNQDIITLCNGGFLVATAHSLPVEHFYKFFRFKRAVEKANRHIGDAQTALLKECGIDPQKFQEAPEDKREEFVKANTLLLDEDSGVEVKARIPFAHYKGVYDENRTQRGDIFADMSVESVLLDNLFDEPEEGEGDE